MGQAKQLYRRVIYGVIGVLLMACSSNAVTPISVPTATLIPPTPTPVQVTPPPTATPRPVINAAQLGTELPPAIATLDDPIERDLAQAVLADVAAEAGLTVDAVDLVLVEAAEWPSATLLGCPVTSGRADVPGYRMLLVAAGTVYEYHTDNLDLIRQCSSTPLTDVRDDLLVVVDPVAAELLAIAQRRLAGRFEIPTRRVRLVEMQATVWPDASLGCPIGGETYEVVAIDGYRLTVTVADENYIFHTAFDRLIECAPEDVVLPTLDAEITPEVTAEATAETTPDPNLGDL